MLYILRHGKTDWNAKNLMQGHTDIPLNEEGRQMAREAAEKYRDVHLDIAFCSPLIRAKETAEILLKDRKIPIVYDDRLIEMSFGACEGHSKETREMDIFFHHPEEYQAVNGAESFEEMFRRTGEFLREVVEPRLARGEDILIVGHGAMNCSILCQVRNIPLEHFWDVGIENCRLIEV